MCCKGTEKPKLCPIVWLFANYEETDHKVDKQSATAMLVPEPYPG